eukprot:TRINITY_DN7020_c0_g1_i2.p1 TRINITY_DN7020_c0_g1~~TRINITY_DN7020_c0_g1_i2.p1  ORF type:complete len:323 (+),score=69.76 TRINITY_DN7020_c0_g1_i2:26-970(+)
MSNMRVIVPIVIGAVSVATGWLFLRRARLQRARKDRAANITSQSPQFQEAIELVRKGAVGKISQINQLRLYALFKQATVGACNIPRPSMIDITGTSKWDVWNALGSMSQPDATAAYIEFVRALVEAAGGVVGDGASAGFSGGFGSRGSKGFTEVHHGADGEVRPSYYTEQRLSHFASEGDVKAVLYALDQQRVNPDEEDEDGLTALMRAADRGHVEIVKVLLSHGAAVNKLDSDDQSSLNYAVTCEHAAVIRLLMAAGASVDSLADDEERELVERVVRGEEIESSDVDIAAAADALAPAQDDDDNDENDDPDFD